MGRFEIYDYLISNVKNNVEEHRCDKSDGDEIVSIVKEDRNRYVKELENYVKELEKSRINK